jgi:histidine triad (HIT) family protein
LEKTESVFSQIIKKKVKAKIIYEDRQIVAFEDINPQAPVHILIVPRRNIVSLSEVSEKDAPLLGKMLLVAKKLAHQLHLDDTGFRVVLNQGKFGGQTVCHLHLHLLGGRRMMWPPG